MGNQPPLSVVLQEARMEMMKATNVVMQTYGLPSSLMDGVICGILADIRAQTAAQLIIDFEQQSAKKDGDSND